MIIHVKEISDKAKSIKNLLSFAKENNNYIYIAVDIVSLLTKFPLRKTINIIVHLMKN